MRDVNSLLEKRIYEFGEFRLNAGERVLEKAGKPVPVTPKALDVLIVLMQSRGHIVEKDLMKKVWPETYVEENSLAFNISVLRKILAENSISPRYIETVPKRGYRFIAEVVEISENKVADKGAPPCSKAQSRLLELNMCWGYGRQTAAPEIFSTTSRRRRREKRMF